MANQNTFLVWLLDQFYLKTIDIGLGLGFQQYFSYIVAISFIGGGNRRLAIDKIRVSEWVSGWLLFNANLAIFQ